MALTYRIKNKRIQDANMTHTSRNLPRSRASVYNFSRSLMNGKVALTERYQTNRQNQNHRRITGKVVDVSE